MFDHLTGDELIELAMKLYSGYVVTSVYNNGQTPLSHELYDVFQDVDAVVLERL